MAGRQTDNPRRSTIFDVAELAGVSIKTVSRVVNNEPNVRDKTRAKVDSAVAKLNYQPNVAARRLSSQRSYVIGLVYENPHEFSYMRDILNGALEACEVEGYSLLLKPITLPDDAILTNIRQFAEQARLDGMILPAPICDMGAVKHLMTDMSIPCARISPRETTADSIDILCNDRDASFELTEYLIAAGHRRIGFVKGHPDHAASHERFAGYSAALVAHDIQYDDSLVIQGYFDFESGKDAALALLDREDPPSAIIASNDDMAAGVIFEAHERGLDIPQALSVVGFDDTPIASQIWPPLTTVRQPIADLAQTATRLLISKLRNDDEPESPEPFACEIVVRGSAGPAIGD